LKMSSARGMIKMVHQFKTLQYVGGMTGTIYEGFPNDGRVCLLYTRMPS